MRRRFRQVDVFTDEPFLGNPVAVVLDADGLTSEQMQRFARWTNLSETTFVLPPTVDGADYQARIFTPEAELPFAGHPTLGTCHAWLEAGGEPAGATAVQQVGARTIAVRSDGDRLAFAGPPLVRSGPVDEPTRARLAAILRIDTADIVAAEWVDNGPGWVCALLADADAVLAVRPGPLEGLDLGVVGPLPFGSSDALEVRAFFSVASATVEDPVCGSLNASIVAWLARLGVVTLPYTARQGTAIGRAGRIHVAVDDDGTVWVGGRTRTCVDGVVEL